MKFMEENGIGRPSTYADILRKIEQREYVRKKDRRFIPTPLGRLVVDLMKEGFEDFFQTEYTARMEEELDEVEEGKVDWRKALKDFDSKFSKDRERAKKQMHSVKAGLEMPIVREAFTDFKLPNDPGDNCPESGHPLKLRMGKAGLFVACSGYPECTYTLDIPETEEDPIDPSELEGQTCEECGSPMRLRTRKNGSAFLGCTAYPKCRNAISVAINQGKAEARPDEPTGREVPGVRPRPREAPRPLRRVRVLLQLPRLPLQAAQARRAHRREVPGVRAGRDPRAPRPLRSLLRLLALPRVPAQLPRSAGAEAVPELRDAVTCSCASARPAASTSARRRAAASRPRPTTSTATRSAPR